MSVKFEIKYKKNMLTLFGGSAFPSGVERQDSLDSIEYKYSSEDEEEDLSDVESDNEISEKSVQDQLKLIRLAKEKNYIKEQEKKKKNIDLEFKIIEDEKKRKYENYFNRLRVINFNSNFKTNRKFWNEKEVPFKEDETLINGHYMTIDMFVNGLLKINDDIANNIIKRIDEHGKKWKKGDDSLPRLDTYLAIALDEQRKYNEEQKENLIKIDADLKKDEDFKKVDKEFEDLKNILFELNKLETRRDIGQYLNDNKLNMTIIINKIRKLNNPEELNNLLNEIRNKK